MRWTERAGLRRARSPEPPPVVTTVTSLATLAAQMERLRVLHHAGLLTDDDLARAELALLDAVPGI